MILLMSLFTMVCAEGIQEKTRHNFLHVWAQKAKKKFSRKGSVSEIESAIDLEMHHLSGTVEFIVKEAEKNPANKKTLNQIDNKIKAVLKKGYRLQHETHKHDKAKLEQFLTEVKRVRAEFQNIEQQRKHISSRSGGGHFGIWDAMALTSILSGLSSLIR